MPGDDAGVGESAPSGDSDGSTTSGADELSENPDEKPGEDASFDADDSARDARRPIDFEALESAAERVPGTDRTPIAEMDLEPAVEWAVDPEGGATAGEYTWQDYLREYGQSADAEAVRQQREHARKERALAVADQPPEEVEPPYPDWAELDAEPPQPNWVDLDSDPTHELGFEPSARDTVLEAGGRRGKNVQEFFEDFCNPETTPVTKGDWMWEHFKREYYYEDDGSRPRDEDGDIVRFDPVEYLGHDPENTENWLATKATAAEKLEDLVDERTVDVNEDIDEDAFFSTVEGKTTVANRYDLEKSVTMEKKRHFREVERYWVNKPYSFVVIFHSDRENEKKYYLVEPYRNPIEQDLQEFLTDKLRTAIKYASEDVMAVGDASGRRSVIERETRKLLDRYDLYEGPLAGDQSLLDRLMVAIGQQEPLEVPDNGHIDGIEARPEPVVLEEDSDQLTQYQVETLLYTLKRNFIGYERIDGIKHDINVEDISCDGYDAPVFVYHTDYENIITNVRHGHQSLDDFVVKLAQQSGKGISKRQPQVDATLPDGSRAQLTLGREVSDHGTNYTIRQFKDVPFTPVDLINWQTFSLEEMAFLWLCIESEKSIVFAGGTASGKTTSLNATSLFIPSNSKIVSIEDTREVELPQRNWIASVTRPSFGEDETGDIDEFDLLEAALRQRPDYIVMGEVRGEEGRTLFQVMSTGHTTYTTFHADNVGEVLKRFTTEPINVSKTLFTALDLVSVQTQTRVRGQRVRRNRSITEINRYDPENDEINVNDVFQWEPEDDTYRKTAESSTLDEIKFDRGWTQIELDRKIQERRILLAYLIDKGLNQYAQVAATVQAYINDPDTILTLIANDQLEAALEDLRKMESVVIDVDPDKEEMVPRPDPGESVQAEVESILENAREDDGILTEYEDKTAESLAMALSPEPEEDVVARSTVQGAEDLEEAIERITDREADDGFGAFEPASDSESGAADGGRPASDDTGDLADSGASDRDATGSSDAADGGTTEPSEVSEGESADSSDDRLDSEGEPE
jgi:flagellar protein FlaI